MNVLVINCGSSSLKYQLIDSDSEKVLAKGLCERIGAAGSSITHTPAGGAKQTWELPMKDHTAAVSYVIEKLTDEKVGVIKSLDEIDAVGHRIVHGGEKFAQSVVIDDEVLSAIEACNDLAPLHNPANLIGIDSCKEIMPGVPMVAVFDTAFHQTMPAKAYLYGLPLSYYKDYKVRRYGFHGTSHRYVSAKGAKFAGLDLGYSKIITCHLGNGSSISAVANGKSIDTSMGFAPLEGIIMGTRCGNIDPDVVTYIQEKEGLSAAEVSKVLNKKSGFAGLSCVSSDARDLDAAANAGDHKAKLTLKKLTYDITKYIGAYTAAMNGVDRIVFTGGIGENNSLTYLGLKFDYEANVATGRDVMISLPDSKVKVAVITTNEELVIAQDTMHIVLNEEE